MFTRTDKLAAIGAAVLAEPPALNVYQFTLPDRTNAVGSYAGERLVWEHEALRIAGGFTKTGEVEGAWLNDGRPQWERNHVYQVAATPDKLPVLIAGTRRIFNDQQAFYVATIGTARMYDGAAQAREWKPLPAPEYDPGADGRDNRDWRDGTSDDTDILRDIARKQRTETK